jgi:lysophospholipase L1-like esterase
MRILFFGDSITDAGRHRENVFSQAGLGCGYVRAVADRIVGEAPDKYQVINMGISGNRIVDLYARVKKDCWNYEPDVISILIGVNEIWHEVAYKNGTELDRFEKVYRMLIEDTRTVLPNAKIILLEPFALYGSATEGTEAVPDRYERFLEVYSYAAVVKRLAEEFDIPFVPLQEKFNECAERIGGQYYTSDGVHPVVGGSALIASEWVKLFKEQIDK